MKSHVFEYIVSREINMFAIKKSIAVLSVVSMFTVLAIGCTEHQTASKTVEVKTPGGTTTVTTQQDIKKTGDHKDK